MPRTLEGGPSGSPRTRSWLIGLVLGILVLLAALVAGVGLIRNHPDFFSEAADRARNIVGPAPVAAVENTVYRVSDWYDRLHYRLTGKADTWAFTAQQGDASVTATAVAPLQQPIASPATAVPPASAAMVVPPVTATRPPAGSASLASPSPAVTATAASSAATAPVAVSPLVRDETHPGPVGAGTASEYKSHPARKVTVDAPSPLSPIISGPALPEEGVWRALATAGQPAGAPPVLWTTVFRPDPARPFAQIALVAMDLSRSQVHIVVGTQEPTSTQPAAGLRTGAIPAEMQAGGTLLAAWNGGFRAIHGHFGMMTDGVTWLPPLPGLATAAIGQDGSLTLGAWGRGVAADGPWAAWRQNDPPLIEDGKVNPDVARLANTIRWGASLDGAVFIWRSGMGLTPGHHWLIYAAGNSLSVETLTRALQAAGVADAMQLDVNASYERFVTFAGKPQTITSGGAQLTLPLTAVRLINQMSGGPTQFLQPYERDFFYLTYR